MFPFFSQKKQSDDGQMMVQKSNTENAYCASLESIKIYFI